VTSSRHQEGRPARIELGRALAASGDLTDDWRKAFDAVDRAAFLPELMWPFDMATSRSTSVDLGSDPEDWYAYADSDVPITTQWDDGAHRGPEPGRVATSSSSMPSVVFAMLADLHLGEDMSVLEIGTGTGWSAGLMTHRLGDGAVTTVEVDADVADRARTALDDAGLRPEVVTADGLAGHPGNAPYDRVIATCGMRSIPYEWIAQTAPGGLIVAPWGTHYGNRDTVVALTVAADGTGAHGHFTRAVEFMKARAQRLVRAAHASYLPDGFPGDATVTTTTLTAADGFADRFGDFAFAAGLRVPGCAWAADERDGDHSVWWYSLTDRSWAAVLFRRGAANSTVHQSGARRLWDEVEAAWQWWTARDRPGPERFGLTVTAGGHRAWLDDPRDSWPLPAVPAAAPPRTPANTDG
jgi:protein-L-isoaspartate O-methyltransferase